MKPIIVLLTVVTLFCACNKEKVVNNLNVEGYWNVKNDTTFTSNSANSGSELYHLFRGPNAFYRFSFLKTHDFSILTSTPRSDSMISYYQVIGDQLMLPNPAPSTTNNVPGNILLSKTDNEMTFTRLIVVRRNAITGVIESTRNDTIRYYRVVDPVKVSYFNNYLKKWHP